MDKEINAIRKYISAQRDTGLNMHPPYCEPALVPKDVEIKFGEGEDPLKCVHQLDYWEEECSNCDGNRGCCVSNTNYMTPNEYQQASLRTANKSLNKKEQLQNGIMGLTGEAGECADLLKKHLFQGHGFDRLHFAKELGDVAWYLAVSADALGYSLETIFKMNICKLKARYPDGFDTNLSVNRKPSDI